MPSVEVSTEVGDAVEVLIKLAYFVEPAGHANGKIKARVSLADLPKVLSLVRGVDVDRGLRLIPGLKSYELSVWFRSATIEYDPEVLPSEFWHHFFALRQETLQRNGGSRTPVRCLRQSRDQTVRMTDERSPVAASRSMRASVALPVK